MLEACGSAQTCFRLSRSSLAIDCYAQAQQYSALRKPYLINDILESNTLLDRRSVYRRLQVHRL